MHDVLCQRIDTILVAVDAQTSRQSAFDAWRQRFSALPVRQRGGRGAAGRGRGGRVGAGQDAAAAPAVDQVRVSVEEQLRRIINDDGEEFDQFLNDDEEFAA
jgi:hypothetical protein